jgi:hypothetical protein
MIDPARVCLFIPGELKKFKLQLFERIGEKIKKAGGSFIKADTNALDALPPDVIPIVGCSHYLRPLVQKWRATGRDFIYWDRGYARRVFATWLPKGEAGGFYRWHFNSFQMKSIRRVPDGRWRRLHTGVTPWGTNGSHIVIARPTPTYALFHGIPDWTEKTVAELKKYTDRRLVFRDKETPKSLREDCEGAHCLVAHGSNAAVEAVIMGCPVFVHPDSAASLVGRTELANIESPIYPDRQPWLNSLAYSQYNESELVDGTLWRLIQ